MALFSRTKKSEQKEVAAKTSTSPAATPVVRDLASVLERPRITEKAVRQNDQNVFTFVVRKDATKRTVVDAVKALYNVTPVKVNIVNKITRKRMATAKGRLVSEKGMKKAYVYLKKGDRISIV